jgi:hypothetical protein
LKKGIRTIPFVCCRNDGIEKQNYQYTYAKLTIGVARRTTQPMRTTSTSTMGTPTTIIRTTQTMCVELGLL